jgi:hypothetical protein
MHRFSAKTASILAAAGWNENTTTDISAYVRQLEQKGSIVFPTVRTFLRNFGRVVLRRPNPHDVRIIGWLDLRVERTLLYELWRLESVSEALEVPVLPIGEDNNAIIYAMDEEEKVCGFHYPTVFFIGDSGEQAIEHYCHWSRSNPFPVIVDIEDQS